MSMSMSMPVMPALDQISLLMALRTTSVYRFIDYSMAERAFPEFLKKDIESL
jgi:hypothetical protein